MSHNKRLDHLFIGFNRKNFIHDIFEAKYNVNIKACANDLGIKPNYLRDILYSNRNAGTKTLTMLYRYCIRNELDPTKYIFYFKEDISEEEGSPL